MSFEEDRDTKQRSFGCISFSLMAHGGLLALLALAPNVTNDPFGLPDGNADSPAAFVDLMSPGSAPEEPQEILLAKADDPTAVVLPQKNLPQPEQKIELPKPLPPKKAEKNAKPVETEKKAERKVEPKKSVAKKTAPEEGDIDVRAALQQAREEEPTRVVEKVDAEAAVQEKSEPVQEDVADLGSDSAEESAPEENSPAAKPETIATEGFTKTETYPEATPAPQKEEAVPQEEVAEAVVPPVPTEDLEEAPREDEKPLPPAPSAANAPKADSMSGVTTASKAAPGGQGSGSGNATRSGRGSGYGIPLGMQIGNADLLREAPGNRPPSYPIEEKLRHKEGTPVIVAQVTPNGTIGQIMLERSSGSALIDQAALKAYKNYRYMPGQQGWVRKAFEFRLTGDARINPARLHRQ